MRDADRRVFSQAARFYKLWILVRRTNPDSLKFIGLAGYVPKPIGCKAKTADLDIGRAKLAGLVVDPTLCPRAFSPTKLVKAIETWPEFCQSQRPGQIGSPYAVVTSQGSDKYGAVTFHGDCLHGDYDLYDIIDPRQPSRNLAAVEMLDGQPHMRGANVLKVQQFVNSAIKANMVQHGGEMQYTDHSDQSIDAFGPDGEECAILNKYSVRGWYAERFSGRQPIDIT